MTLLPFHHYRLTLWTHWLYLVIVNVLPHLLNGLVKICTFISWVFPFLCVQYAKQFWMSILDLLVLQSPNHIEKLMKLYSVEVEVICGTKMWVSLVSGMQNKTVSVFETTIRILGGLLSAHLIASDYATVNSCFIFTFWHVLLSSECWLSGPFLNVWTFLLPC